MLFESFAGEMTFFNRATDLSGRHPWDAGPFRPTWHQPSFARLGVTIDQDAAEIEWRQRTIERFRAYPSFNARFPQPLPGATVYTVFHAAPSLEVAKTICATGFAQLAATDAGWFSQGLYFTFELDYAVENYGTPDADGNVTVLVCNVVVGNLYPVIEDPDGATSLKGKPGVPKYDAHGVLVREGPCKPCPPAQWGAGPRMFSELVVFDSASILPRCILGVRKQ